MEIIKVENLNFSYKKGDFFKLKDISFSCNQKSIIGIAGPNGCGKSTLLKLLSGIEKPLKGNIYLSGKILNNYNSIERAKILRWFGQWEEKPIPYKVIDYLKIGLFPKIGFFGSYLKEDDIKIKEMLSFFELDKKINYQIESLSGGEKKIIQVIFCLVSDPKILILDEPFVHLDPAHLKNLISLIKREKEKGKLIILSSHEYNILKFISDHILILSEGSMLIYEKPEEISLKLWEKAFGIPFIEEKIRDKKQIIPDIF